MVTAAAGLADEIGYHALTMGLLAQRLGVRTPSLYKHVEDLADLQHRIATWAMTELGEAVHDALQVRSGLDTLSALVTATRAYVTAHPGRYTATIGAEFAGRPTRFWRPGPASSAPSPPRSADTTSATARWTTPSAPSAAPSTDSPSCRPRVASGEAGPRCNLRLDDRFIEPRPEQQ